MIFVGDKIKCEVDKKGKFIIEEIKNKCWSPPNGIIIRDGVKQIEIIGNIYEGFEK